MSETKSQSPEPSTAPDSVSPKPQVPLPSDCVFFVHGPSEGFSVQRVCRLARGPSAAELSLFVDAWRGVQAMKSAVTVGGPDDAAPTSEMAGLAIKDGAARSDEEGDGPTAKESSAEGHHGRYGRELVQMHVFHVFL